MEVPWSSTNLSRSLLVFLFSFPQENHISCMTSFLLDKKLFFDDVYVGLPKNKTLDSRVCTLFSNVVSKDLHFMVGSRSFVSLTISLWITADRRNETNNIVLIRSLLLSI